MSIVDNPRFQYDLNSLCRVYIYAYAVMILGSFIELAFWQTKRKDIWVITIVDSFDSLVTDGLLLPEEANKKSQWELNFFFGMSVV